MTTQQGSKSSRTKDLRSVVPDSKPYRALMKGKKWKTCSKVLESRSEVDAPSKGVR